MKFFPKGSATIELMVALLVLATMLTAAATVAYGNQSMTMDTELYQEGLYDTSAALESARAELTKDINTSLVPASSDISYSTNTISDCAKEVTATKSWTAGDRDQEVSETTKIVSPAAIKASGSSCFLSSPGGGWDCPLSGSFDNITPDIEPTALDVVSIPGSTPTRLAYVTSIKKNREVFLIYDVTNADDPAISLSPITAPIIGPNDDTAGYYDLAVVWEPDGSSAYAYVVGRDPTKHLQIIDVDPSSSDYNTVISGGTFALPSNTGNALSVDYIKREISGVPKKVLYIGTKNNSVGPEFYAVDVTTPSAPALLGSPKEVGADINAIVATTDDYAYLATNKTSGELISLNVSDLSSIILSETNLSPDEPGHSLFKVGDRLYFGRDDEDFADANPDFLIFNINARMTPAFITGIDTNGDVTGLVIASDLAFLATSEANKELKVRRGIQHDAICFFSDSQLSNKGIALDYESESDRVYILASGGSTDLKIYKPNPATCPDPPPACP